MAVPSVDKLSYKQLLDLQTRISKAIDARKQEEKLELKRRMTELAAASGFEIGEVLGKQRGVRKGSTVAPKYRHPKDPSLTWTGRGRQPNWLTAELKKGRKLDSFLI